MSSDEYLFYIGIVLPTTITVVLFIIFLWCMYRYKARRKVLTEIYAPHSKGWPDVCDVTPPCSTTYYREPLIYDESNPEAKSTGDFVQSDLASRHQDSGIADIGDISRSSNHGAAPIKKPNQRPYSQASTDSDDSGFRSSRSAHYLHKHDTSRGKHGECQLRDAELVLEGCATRGCDPQRVSNGRRSCNGHLMSVGDRASLRQKGHPDLQHDRSNPHNPQPHTDVEPSCPHLNQIDARQPQGYHDDHHQRQLYHDSPLLQGLNDLSDSHKHQCVSGSFSAYPRPTFEYLPQTCVNHSAPPPYRKTDLSYSPTLMYNYGDFDQSNLGYKCDSIGLRHLSSHPSALTFTTASVHANDAQQSCMPVFSVV